MPWKAKSSTTSSDGRGFRRQLVIVTGAGNGIGRATALAFAGEGAEVIAADIDGQAAARTAELADEHGCDCPTHHFTVDVSDSAAMQSFAEEARETHGVPDVLVNNAGIAVAGKFLDTDVADWERIIGVNLWGAIHGSRLFGAQMTERGRGGHIVNVASAAAYLPSRSLPAYSTTKAAVFMLSQCLRAELADHGIGVTAVCPGFVSTAITQAAHFVGVGEESQERIREFSSRSLTRRNYAPERVAAHIVRAVRDNKAVVPVNAEAKVGYVLSRMAPWAVRGLARAAALREPPRLRRRA